MIALLARFVTWLIQCFPILSYDYRHRRIRAKQFCPACANKVKIEARYVPHLRQVVVQCPLCLACWGYNTAVQASIWSQLPKVDE